MHFTSDCSQRLVVSLGSFKLTSSTRCSQRLVVSLGSFKLTSSTIITMHYASDCKIDKISWLNLIIIYKNHYWVKTCTYTHVIVCPGMPAYTHTHTHTHTHTLTHSHTPSYVRECLHVFTYVCMHMCMLTRHHVCT